MYGLVIDRCAFPGLLLSVMDVVCQPFAFRSIINPDKMITLNIQLQYNSMISAAVMTAPSDPDQ